MKLPKLKLNLNVKPLLNYILIIVITAVFISLIFLALPLTEKFISKATYNLNTKNNSYWSEEYIISTENTDENTLNETRNIFYKRLKGFGVEEVSTYVENDKIRVVVTSSLDKDLVTELLSNRFEVEIVTRKSDVDFDSETYAYLLSTNYDSTVWTKDKFRDVYLTKLKNTNNEYSYFAIFKLWPQQVDAFNNFLSQYNGQYIGVNIDGYVTPHLVDTTSKLFAIPISTENTEQLKVISLLYNSGIITTNIKIDSQTALTPNIPSVNYISLTIAIFVGLVLFYAYIFISKAASFETVTRTLLATMLTISAYLAFLKFTQLPIDTFILAIEAILVILLTKVLSENRDSIFIIEVTLFIVLGIVTFLGGGYLSVIARDLLVLTILSKLCLIISRWYINKVKKI